MKRFILCLVGCIVWLGFGQVNEANAQGDASLPEPHLGYGIHLDPNVPVDPAIVDRMGMDWVKLYADHQLGQFPNKRILYRQDMDYPSDWNAFRDWLAGRVRILQAAGVDAIEIHNEPNLAIEWGGRIPNAVQYTEMLRNSYQVVKSVAPEMIVVSGGLAPTVTTPERLAITDIDYAEEMLRNGAGQYFDAFGYHPYGYNAPPEQAPAYLTLNFRRTELIWALLNRYGITDKQIWLTEFGWVRDPAEDGVTCSADDPAFSGFAWMRVDGNTQADYIARAFAYADRNWEWAGPTFLWNLNFSQRADDGSLPLCSHMRWFGLLKRDGTPTIAFNRVVSMPKRYSRYEPQMTLYSDDMTVETSVLCPNEVLVGRVQVQNTGYPGSLVVSVNPSQSPTGPPVRVSQATLQTGQGVDIFANTASLQPGLHVIYVNLRTTIGGQIRAQNVRGFVVVGNDGTNCP